MLRVVVRAACLVVVFAGCASGLSAGTTQQVQRQAAADLSCPAAELSIRARPFDVDLDRALRAVDPALYSASGCGRRALYSCAQSSLSSVRCDRLPTSGSLPEQERPARVRSKAAALLACYASSVEVVSLKRGFYAAKGCGKTVTYECISRADCCAFVVPGVQPIGGPDIPDASCKGCSYARSAATRAALESAQPRLRACYVPVIESQARATGVVDFAIAVAENGVVNRVEVVGSSLDRRDVEACGIEALREARFPRHDRDEVIVRHGPSFTTAGPFPACR